MASPFDSAGYEDVRSYIQSNWTHVALVDDDGNEVTRINITSDSRSSWSSGSGSNPLEATITVAGGDSDIDVQSNGTITIVQTESYRGNATSTRMAADPFTDATVEATNDEVTITHTIEHPPQ